MKKNKKWLLVVMSIFMMTGSFWLGRMTTNRSGALNNRRQGTPMINGQRQVFGGSQTGQGRTIGQIDKINNNQLTVKLMAGGSRLLMVPAEAVITKMSSGTTADLVVGQNIVASGSEENGMVVVKTLQISPLESQRSN